MMEGLEVMAREVMAREVMAQDVMAQDVGTLGIFSDWPATVTDYANGMGPK